MPINTLVYVLTSAWYVDWFRKRLESLTFIMVTSTTYFAFLKVMHSWVSIVVISLLVISKVVVSILFPWRLFHSGYFHSGYFPIWTSALKVSGTGWVNWCCTKQITIHHNPHITMFFLTSCVPSCCLHKSALYSLLTSTLCPSWTSDIRSTSAELIMTINWTQNMTRKFENKMLV